MELKKISSASDPDVVKKNRQRIEPILPCVIAVSVQLVATLYLNAVSAPTKSIIASAVLTALYVFISYLLIKKPSKRREV